MSPLSFPPSRRGAANLTWPRAIGAVLLMATLVFIMRSCR